MGLILELVKECDVRWESLSEITSLKAGDRIIKSQMSDDFLYPVYGGGVKPTGQFDKYNFENSITISRAGSAGHVNWVDGKFWATDVCFVASQKDESCLIKYIFYCVKNMQFDLQKHIYGGNLPKLDKLYLWNLKIPIPPLDTQSKIVQILDNFTELTAELGLRKKQYEYYRDKLLSFDITNPFYNEISLLYPNGVEYKSIKEVADNYTGLTYKPSNVSSSGTLVLRSTNIQGNTLSFQNNVFVNMEKIPTRAIVQENDILVCVRNGSSSLVGKVAIIPKLKETMAFGAFMTILRAKKEIIDYKYLFFVWQSSKIQLQIKGNDAMPIKQITNKDFNRIKIPIPPLETQQKIVNILDKFNTLANSLEQGLPKEIELRVKQYEYYRDKLLDFKKP